MNSHWGFFKEGDTSLGTFYPRHYIVAGFHNLADAQAAEAEFRRAGTPPEDVRAADGDFVTGQLESRRGANWLERMEQRLVEFAGTETGYIREDADLARDGGAFLFVYAPDDSRATPRGACSRRPILPLHGGIWMSRSSGWWRTPTRLDRH